MTYICACLFSVLSIIGVVDEWTTEMDNEAYEVLQSSRLVFYLLHLTIRNRKAFFLSCWDQYHHIDKFRMKHLEAMKDKDNHFALEMARINADLEKTKMELSKNMMMKDWLLAVLAILLCLVLLSPSKSDFDIMDVCKMLLWSLMSVCIWETFWISLSNMLCTQSCTAKMSLQRNASCTWAAANIFTMSYTFC